MNKDNEPAPAVSSEKGAFIEEPLFAMALLAESRSAESMEGRGPTEENMGQSPLDRAQSRIVDGQWPSQVLGQPSTARSRGLLGVSVCAKRRGRTRR
jgi:hypothetical protein